MLSTASVEVLLCQSIFKSGKFQSYLPSYSIIGYLITCGFYSCLGWHARQAGISRRAEVGGLFLPYAIQATKLQLQTKNDTPQPTQRNRPLPTLLIPL